MFEHDGPLFDTKISQVLTGKLKWAAHAFFKLFRLKSSNWKSTNSLGCTGRYVCFESGSDASLWTMISFGADPFFFRAPDIASAALTLLLLISAWRRSHVSCLRLIVVSKIDCARTAWNVINLKSPSRALFARETAIRWPTTSGTSCTGSYPLPGNVAGYENTGPVEQNLNWVLKRYENDGPVCGPLFS